MRHMNRIAILLIASLMFSTPLLAVTGSITANFNNTSISGGHYIWFNSSVHVMGLGNHPAKIFVRNASIMFESGGASYIVPVPDSDITFEPNMGVATTVFENGAWKVHAQPCCSSGNTFLAGVSFNYNFPNSLDYMGDFLGLPCFLGMDFGTSRIPSF